MAGRGGDRAGWLGWGVPKEQCPLPLLPRVSRGQRPLPGRPWQCQRCPSAGDLGADLPGCAGIARVPKLLSAELPPPTASLQDLPLACSFTFCLGNENLCSKGSFGAQGLVCSTYCIRSPRQTNKQVLALPLPDWCGGVCWPGRVIPQGRGTRFSLLIPPACRECRRRRDGDLLSCSVTSPVLVLLPECFQRATQRESIDGMGKKIKNSCWLL